MNAGYLSLLLVIVALILFASGWKEVIVRGITQSSLLLFFITWLLLSRLKMEWGGVHWYGSAAVLLGVSLVVFMKTKGMLLRLHWFSVALLIGSVLFFLKETMHLMPSFILWNECVTAALFSGGISAMLLRAPFLQLGALAASLLIGEGMFLYAHREHSAAVFGDTGFTDIWWMSVFVSRGGSLVVEGLITGLSRLLRLVSETIRVRKP